VVIAALQGYGVSIGLESMQTAYGNIVFEPGLFFRVTTVITLVGGTVFLMWLGEQISSRGVGNGISLIITAGIIANLPSAVVSTLQLGRTGELSIAFILSILILIIGLIILLSLLKKGKEDLLFNILKDKLETKYMGVKALTCHLK
jgi:preprotein translocase subunit SecY